jgi:hypothetical protein
VLRQRSCSRLGRREVRTLEVVGSEVGHTTADIGPELGHRLLDLGWVVVRLAFICFRDPVGSRFEKLCRGMTI